MLSTYSEILWYNFRVMKHSAVICNDMARFVSYNIAVERFEIGQRIKAAVIQARKSHASRADLVKELGISDNTLRAWEKGEVTSINFGALLKLFELAGMSMDEAFGLSGQGLDAGGVDWRAEAELYKDILRHLRATGTLNPDARPQDHGGQPTEDQLAAERDTISARRRAASAIEEGLDAAGRAARRGKKDAKDSAS